jgi:hypothetical protein
MACPIGSWLIATILIVAGNYFRVLGAIASRLEDADGAEVFEDTVHRRVRRAASPEYGFLTKGSPGRADRRAGPNFYSLTKEGKP